MATETIPGTVPVCKAASAAYFDALCTCECLGIDAERLAETAFALSTAELFNEGAQHAFHSLGVLAQNIARNAKKNEDRFDALRQKGGH